MIDKLEALWNNPAFLIIALVASLTVIVANTMIAVSAMRGRKNDIANISNRDQKAMDELSKLVEGLKEKEK